MRPIPLPLVVHKEVRILMTDTVTHTEPLEPERSATNGAELLASTVTAEMDDCCPHNDVGSGGVGAALRREPEAHPRG